MTRTRKTAGLMILVGVMLAAGVANAASRKAKEMLAFIPAETPYAMVSLEPIPDALAAKVEPAMDDVLAGYQRMLRYVMAEQLVELANQEDGAEQAVRLQGVVDEVIGLMSIEGIRGAGIARDSAFALYGYGLLPVLRTELTAAAAFEAAITRIEEKAGEKLPVGKVANHAYRFVDLDALRVIIATIGDHVVITLVPGAFQDAQLEAVLGISKPRNNLAKSKELSALARKYGFTNHFSGFINVQRIADSFLGDPSGLNEDLLRIAEYDSATVSDVCKTEFKALAGVAPRIVFGYSAINEKFIDSRLVVELRKDIAKGLAALPAFVPGLGVDPGGFMSIGFSMNPLAARAFYEARLDAMEAEPFECEAFAELQASVPQGREALAQPVPPVVYGFRGVLLNVFDIVGLDLATDEPPESVDASVLLAVENAQDLVTMAAMMDPQIAALNLLPDGKPVRLELPQLAELAEDAFVALSELALTLALGGDAEARAAGMLNAKSVEPPPLFSISMDSARYYALLGEAMMLEPDSEEEEPMPLPMRTAMRDITVAAGNLYDRMIINVRLTETGVDVDSRLTLKQ